MQQRCLALLVLVLNGVLLAEEPSPNQLQERVVWRHLRSGVRTHVNVPVATTGRPRTMLIYATPNGNSIEQTLGSRSPFAPRTDASGRTTGTARGAQSDQSSQGDFRYNIQHVAAQVRMLREQDDRREWLLAVTDCAQRSWPSFRQIEPYANRKIGDHVNELVSEFAADEFVLAGHSGGGSYIFGFIESAESLPSSLVRIIFLDANYSYDDALHANKLLTWLQGDRNRHLIVIAYDDREIMLDGKKVVGPTGGTYRATERIVKRFRDQFEIKETTEGPFRHFEGCHGKVQMYVHRNPENKILHTALVGEMNGLLHGVTVGDRGDQSGFGLSGPRAYEHWIQATPEVDPKSPDQGTLQFSLAIPARPADAMSGSELAKQIEALPLEEREQAILGELRSGNVPDRLRTLKAIHVTARDKQGRVHHGTYFVTPDYVAVGNNQDFLRVPLTPGAAELLADDWNGSLITTKVADDIFAEAELRLVPHPMPQDRESMATFLEHQRIIESQWHDAPPNSLVAGIKKDVVITRLLEPDSEHVAIYGWHKPDGEPIQPLYVKHRNTYVDYSHGIRLMADRMWVDGKPVPVREVLRNPSLSGLLSNE